MRFPWQRAPGWAQPEGLARKGWTQVVDGGVTLPLWSNGKGMIGALRYKQREGGVLGQDRFWYACSETGPKLKLLVEDLASAERVEALAEAEVDQLLEDVLPECDDGELDKVWAASVEEVYSVALDEQLERDEKMLKDACVAEIFEDIGKLQKQCRKFARKKLGKKKETWLEAMSGTLMPPIESFCVISSMKPMHMRRAVPEAAEASPPSLGDCSSSLAAYLFKASCLSWRARSVDDWFNAYWTAASCWSNENRVPSFRTTNSGPPGPFT